MPRYFAFPGIAGGALLGMLLTASTAAMADPTTLVCNSADNGSLGADTFVLNEVQKSVAISYSVVRARGGETIAARSSGPLPATFAPNAITFSEKQNNGDLQIVIDFTINRLSGGIVSSAHVIGHPDADWSNSWTCQVGKARF